MAGFKPFEYSKSILSKNYMDDMKGFVPFLMAKLFSGDPDYVALANLLNKIGMSQLSKRAIYDFYFHTIPKSNRFLKYPKKESELKMGKYIMEYYGIDEKEARDYLVLLPKSDLKQIANYFEKRGVEK